MTTVRPNASVFLDPELIHTGERIRPFGLERVPAIEIAHEKIAGLGNAVERRVEQVLPAAADVVRGGAIALLANEGARGNDVTACELAVKAHTHEAARPQQSQQDAPARHRFRKVMQYPAGIDQVERSLERSEVEDVGLSGLDPFRQRRGRLPLGVPKTGEAAITGQDP